MTVFVPSAKYDPHLNRWDMGDPDSIVRHFNSAAAKAKYLKIKAELEADEENIEAAYRAATHQVPVYRGYDKATMSYFMRQAKRVQRRAQEVAIRGVEVDEDELEH